MKKFWIAAMAAGACGWLAARVRAQRAAHEPAPDCVDCASEDSFPASDPPSYTGASAS